MAHGGRTLVKLEEKVLEFEFEILNVQYNKSGEFYLRLSVQNAHRSDLLEKTTVEVNSGIARPSSKITTDTVSADGDSTLIIYEQRKFKFKFPAGFCKNDGMYDVHLLVEAFRKTPQSKKNGSEKMGEGKFAIYPRTELPRANLFVKKGEDYYNYSGIMSLLRPLTRASLSMHCGRLTYKVAFREFLEPGFVFQESDEEEIPISPVPEEEAVTTEDATEKDARRSIIENTKRQPEPISPPATVIEKVRSMDRTTQWTPQQEYFSPEPLESEHSFHISFPPTPLPEDSNHPTNREKTMDAPAVHELPSSTSPPNKPTKSPPKKVQPKRSKSPTITSPKADRKAGNLKLDHHVARPGYEEIYVIVHGATSLPSRSDGQDPLPFVTLKSIADERGLRTAQSATHATLQATHSPTWEEVLMMEVSDSTANEEEVILTISDSASREKLVTFRIPVKNLVPFHPYHFELIQPTKSIASGIRVYTTIQRRSSYLPRLSSFGFCGLEVILRSLHRKLSTPAGPLLAVARIVPDYTLYKERMLSRRAAGITTTTVTFPSPHPSAFEIPEEQMQGYPQLTTASSGNSLPTWDHTFMFCGSDTATMFTHNSALVIEYYPATSSMTTVTWTIRSPIGFSTLLLDDEVFRALTSEPARLGVRVDDLLVQGSQFETQEGAYPSVDLILRLIHTERPDSLATAAVPSILPVLDAMPASGSDFNPLTDSTDGPLNHQQDEGGLLDISGPDSLAGSQLPLDRSEPPPEHQRKKTHILVKEDEYPPSDILETILPQYVLTDSDTGAQYLNKQDTRNPDQNMAKQRTKDPIENNSMTLVGHQAKELQNYREAMKRMAGDIVKLREDISKLQNENHELRRELMMHKEMGEIIRSDINSGVVSSEEVADKFVAVKTKLNEESGELKKYKAKVQHLQNLLIKANEREKQYLNDSTASKNREEDVKQTQDKLRKVKKLEDTCLQQEKVIEKMEKLLSKYLHKEGNTVPGRNRKAAVDDYDASQQVSSLLTQENARLRMEFEALKLQDSHNDAEKEQLMAKLERAENRISTLESQLEKNSRRWARERHELTVRLQEHRNGFMRSTAGDATGLARQDSILLAESASYSDVSSIPPCKARHRNPTPFVAPITRPLLPHIPQRRKTLQM